MILVPLLFLERTEVLLWCCSSSIAHLTPQTLVIFLVQPLILVSFQIQHLDLKNIRYFSKRILFLIWPPAFLPLFVLILASESGSMPFVVFSIFPTDLLPAFLCSCSRRLTFTDCVILYPLASGWV